MHDNSKWCMIDLLQRHIQPAARMDVGDVGSMDINGSYREIITQRKWDYTGYDVAPGKNVDFALEPNWRALPRKHELVITGQTMEHVRDIYQFAENLRDSTNSCLIVIAPNTIQQHRYPVDCWRFWPDGMLYLFEDRAGMTTIECGTRGVDTYWIGKLR